MIAKFFCIVDFRRLILRCIFVTDKKSIDGSSVLLRTFKVFYFVLCIIKFLSKICACAC
jgi:hypothetical protein